MRIFDCDACVWQRYVVNFLWRYRPIRICYVFLNFSNKFVAKFISVSYILKCKCFNRKAKQCNQRCQHEQSDARQQ